MHWSPQMLSAARNLPLRVIRSSQHSIFTFQTALLNPEPESIAIQPIIPIFNYMKIIH